MFDQSQKRIENLWFSPEFFFLSFSFKHVICFIELITLANVYYQKSDIFVPKPDTFQKINCFWKIVSEEYIGHVKTQFWKTCLTFLPKMQEKQLKIREKNYRNKVFNRRYFSSNCFLGDIECSFGNNADHLLSNCWIFFALSHKNGTKLKVFQRKMFPRFLSET